MTAAFDPDKPHPTTILAKQRAAYLTRLRTQIAATMADDPLADYFTTLIQQIAQEAWDAGYQTGHSNAREAG